MALIPLAILIYGTGMQSKVFLAAFASLWQILVARRSTGSRTSTRWPRTPRARSGSRAQRLFRVTLPSAVPYIATGLRIASAVSLILMVTAELVIGAPGPGARDQRRRVGGNEELMYALILATGILGSLLNLVFVRGERRVLHWHPSQPWKGVRHRRPRPAPAAGRAAARDRGRRCSRSALWALVRNSDTTTSRRSPKSSRRSPTPGCSSGWEATRPEPAAMGAGFAIAVVSPSALGLASGLGAGAARAAPIVEFLRAIPPPALLPFAILVIGVGDSMKVFIIAFVCLWPVLLNTIDGVAGVDPTLRETARAYRIRHALRPPRDAAGPRRRSSPACGPASRWR